MVFLRKKNKHYIYIRKIDVLKFILAIELLNKKLFPNSKIPYLSVEKI